MFVFALILALLRAGLIRQFRREEMDERELEGGFQNQIAFIVKSFFFALIGFMLAPPWPLIVFGVGIGVVLIVARAPAVYLATLFGKMGRGGKRPGCGFAPLRDGGRGAGYAAAGGGGAGHGRPAGDCVCLYRDDDPAIRDRLPDRQVEDGTDSI